MSDQIDGIQVATFVAQHGSTWGKGLTMIVQQNLSRSRVTHTSQKSKSKLGRSITLPNVIYNVSHVSITSVFQRQKVEINNREIWKSIAFQWLVQIPRTHINESFEAHSCMSICVLSGFQIFELWTWVRSSLSQNCITNLWSIQTLDHNCRRTPSSWNKSFQIETW